MELKEFTKEGIIKSITRLLRSGICIDYASEYADLLESGEWLDEDVWKAIESNEALRASQS